SPGRGRRARGYHIFRARSARPRLRDRSRGWAARRIRTDTRSRSYRPADNQHRRTIFSSGFLSFVSATERVLLSPSFPVARHRCQSNEASDEDETSEVRPRGKSIGGSQTKRPGGDVFPWRMSLPE